MKLALLVFVGGGLGALARWGAAVGLEAWAPRVHAAFPWATLAVNVLGCAMIGAGTGCWAREGAPYAEEARALLLIGFCGGLTTFSTFAHQTLVLSADDFGRAALNVLLSVALCLGACWLGLRLTSAP